MPGSMRSWQNSTIWTLGRLDRIAVRDLSAKETGKDETEYCDDGEYDYLLVACPRERKVTQHAEQIPIEGKGAEGKKEGDKHRR